HRGGPLLELGGAGAATATCPATFDPAQPLYCTFVQWAALERAAIGNPNASGPGAIVFVSRPKAGLDRSLLDFDAYRPGADLRAADITFDAAGKFAAPGGSRSLLGTCSGVTVPNADVRGPDVASDGTSVAFALRNGSSDKFHIYIVNVDGTNCRAITSGTAG